MCDPAHGRLLAIHDGFERQRRRAVDCARASFRRCSRSVSIAVGEFLGVAGETVVLRHASATGPDSVYVKLAELAAWLRIEHVPQNPGETSLVDLIGSRPHGRIAIAGKIRGRLLEPLVQTLRALATHDLDFETPATPALLRELANGAGAPVDVGVFVSRTCPFCPLVTATACRFAVASTHVAVNIVVIDAEDTCHVPDTVRAVPTVVVGGRVVSTGAIAEYALVQLIRANVA